MRQTAVFNEGAEEENQGSDEQERLAGQEQDNTRAQQRDEREKNEDGSSKFHLDHYIHFARGGKLIGGGARSGFYGIGGRLLAQGANDGIQQFNAMDVDGQDSSIRAD